MSVFFEGNAFIDGGQLQNAAVTSCTISNSAIYTSSLDMNLKNITNVKDPVQSQDAATKQYVDDLGIIIKDYLLEANVFTEIPESNLFGTYSVSIKPKYEGNGQPAGPTAVFNVSKMDANSPPHVVRIIATPGITPDDRVMLRINWDANKKISIAKTNSNSSFDGQYTVKISSIKNEVILAESESDVLNIEGVRANFVSAGELVSNNISSGTISVGSGSATIFAVNQFTGSTVSTEILTTKTIFTNNITSSYLSMGVATTGHLLASNISTGTIQSGHASAGNLATQNITTSTLSSGIITTGTLIAKNVISDVITLNGIATDNFETVSITTNQLLSEIISTGTLLADTIVSDSLNFNGNLGIGTAFPTTKLDIDAGEANVPSISLLSSGSESSMSFKNTGIGGQEYCIGSASIGADAGSGNFYIYDATTQEVRMVISSSGNMGVGTTTPTEKLDIVGSSIIRGKLGVGAGLSAIGQTPNGHGQISSPTFHVLNDASMTGSGEVMRLERYSGQGDDIISSSEGYIGLYLNDDNIGGGEVARISWKDGQTGNTDPEGTGELGFWTSNTGNANGVPVVRMTIKKDGYVGIGTTTPVGKMDVTYEGITANKNVLSLHTANTTTTEYNLIEAGHGNSTSFVLRGNGNVGIGTTTPEEKLTVNGKTVIYNGTVGLPANGTYGGNNGTRLVLWPGSSSTTPYALGINGSTLWYGVPSGATHRWFNGTTEVMTLNGSGSLGIGTTSPVSKVAINGDAGANGVLQIVCTNDGRNIDAICTRAINNNNYIINFRNTSGGEQGKIRGTGAGGVAYDTSSDRRLKENIRNMPSMVEKIKQLKPVEFDWIEDKKHDYGFIAQDVYKVFPIFKPASECLENYCEMDCHQICEENPVKKDGTPYYYGLDYGKLTPYLTKALQETIDELEKVKTDLEAEKSARLSLETRLTEIEARLG